MNDRETGFVDAPVQQGERDPEADELPTSTEGWYSEWRVTWEPPKVKSKLLRFMRGHAPEPAH